MKRLLPLLLPLFFSIGAIPLSKADVPTDEPEITIKRGQTEIIEEYRINGQLYMIKITPRKGLAYFLVDTDGDGTLDSRHNELDEGLLIPKWTLFKW